MNKDIQKLLQERYYAEGEKCWGDIANRVSTIYPPIKEHIEKMEFIPSSPTLMNWDTKRTGTLSSCFPVAIKDSIEDIFETLANCAKITKYSGGIGIDFSTLRSSKESVTGIGDRKSSGPLPFIQIFNSMLDGVSQGGCFVGDTLVATSKGPVKIKDIEDGDLVYCWKDGMKLKPAKKAWKTKENTQLVRIKTDKGLEIYCTPDHLFLNRYSKKYTQAKDLKINTPLMPLTRYIKDNEWFLSIQDGKDTRCTEHRWLMENLGSDITNKHIHHIDGNHLNNSIENLELLTSQEHASIHGKQKIEEGSHPFLNLSEKSKQKRIDNFSKTYKMLDEDKKKQWKENTRKSLKMAGRKLIENGTHHWLKNHPNNDPVISKKAKQTKVANSLWAAFEAGFSPTEENWEDIKNKIGLNQQSRYRTEFIINMFGTFNNALSYCNERNDKIISIEYAHCADVYDIEVPDVHNFVVCSNDMKHGVVVHNSRRGSGMSQLSINHPDILQFIEAKKNYDDKRFNRFNFSVRIPDEFYDKLKTKPDSPHMIKNVVNGLEYYLQDDQGNTITVKQLWDKIVELAWFCVTKDTYISVVENNINKIFKFEDFYNEYNLRKTSSEFLVESLNLKTQKIEYKKIIDAQKYKNNKKVFEISVNGQTLEVTEDHIFYTFDGNEIISKPIKDFMEGDVLLLSKSNKMNEGFINKIETLELPFIKNCEITHRYTLEGNIKNALENIPEEEINKFSLRNIYEESINNKKLNLKYYYTLIDKNFNIDTSKLKLKMKNSKIPLEIEFDEYFMCFLGLYFADGSFNKNSISIHCNKNEVSSYTDMLDILSERFNCNYKINFQYDNYTRIEIYSTFLRNFINYYFKDSSGEKTLNNIFLNLKNDATGWFLKGFFSGDGMVSKSGRISVSQSNIHTIKSIQYMLRRLGIYCYITEGKGKEKNVCGKLCNCKQSYVLILYSQFNYEFKEKISFLQQNKINRIKVKAKSSLFGLPVKFLDVSKKYTSGYKYNMSINRIQSKRVFQTEKIYNLLQKDFYFGILKRKKEIEYYDFVYDITVEDNHTFVLNNGIILSNCAEPGIFNSDIAFDRCTVTNVNKHVLSNPCLKEDATVIKKDAGVITLKKLQVGDFIWSREGWTKVTAKFPTGNKEVFKYYTKDDNCFESTENHEVECKGVKSKVKDAKFIDCFSIGLNKNKHTFPIEKMCGESLGFHNVWDITVDNKSHTFWCQGFSVSNCSEFTNIPYSACSLGSINLSLFVKNKEFEWDRFYDVVKKATRFLDNTIDVNCFPISDIEYINQQIRPIGLGFMGIAHALMKLEIPYASEKGREFIRDVSRGMTLCSMRESVELAKEKGRGYPAFNYDLFCKANKRFIEGNESLFKEIEKYEVRNSCFTSIAPTGTISFCSETSSGIEPVFSLGFIRKIEKGKDKEGNIIYEEVYIADKAFDNYIKKKYKDQYDEIMSNVTKNKGSCQKSKILTDAEREIFKTSQDLTAQEHLYTLAECANNISLSVSKTINLPQDAKKEDVSEVYMLAHEMGIIGVTVYREGSREGVLIINKDETNKKVIKTIAPKRPRELEAELYHVTLQKQKYYVAVGLYYNDPFEVFTGYNEFDNKIYIPINIKQGKIIKEKSGHYTFKPKDEEIKYALHGIHNSDTAEALTRQISLSLRHGANIVYIIDQLNKIKTGDMFCFSRVLARTLKKYIPENFESTTKCPECGAKMIYEGGCVICKNCGTSPKCS